MGMTNWTLGVKDILEKLEFWKLFAEKINAEFKLVTTVSKDLNKLQMKLIHNKVAITFTETDTKPLLVECIFNHGVDLTWFEIAKSDSIDRILNKFSRNKIKSSYPEFNRIYLSKSANNHKIRAIINNRQISDLILKQDISFIGGKKGKDEAYKLNINAHRNINSIEQLESVYNLTIMLIDTFQGKENIA